MACSFKILYNILFSYIIINRKFAKTLEELSVPNTNILVGLWEERENLSF